jgi:predicted TIM-barrel fold metal-dependent hydrolase
MMDMHNRARRDKREPAEFYIIKQATDLSELINCESGKYNLLPFIPIDPTISEEDREAFDHFNIFLKAFRGEYGFTPSGIKIYPSLGYLPSHPLLMPIYEICEKKNIPITAHCSSGTVHAYFRRIKNIKGWKIGKDGESTQMDETKWFLFFQKNKYENYFNHPKNWDPVLQRYPNLKINFAHFGGARQWRKLIKGKQNTWVTQIIDYFTRYQNVYADLSFTNAFPEINRMAKERLISSELIRNRVIYGFDYYMVVKEGHYRTIKADFDTLMGEELIDTISRTNPVRFLF